MEPLLSPQVSARPTEGSGVSSRAWGESRRFLEVSARSRSECARTASVEAAERALGVSAWPIGAILATHWVARGSGPSPDGPAVFEAVGFGLINIADEWSVTARGRAALREHGWL